MGPAGACTSRRVAPEQPVWQRVRWEVEVVFDTVGVSEIQVARVEGVENCLVRLG